MKSFVKFRPKSSRRRQARRFSPWFAALERLEDRCLLTHSLGVATDGVFVLEPGANANQPSGEPFQFSDGARWSSTTTDGSGLTQGQPTTLTWGIVLDGSTITPDTVQHPSESSADSSLISFFDGLYGSGPGGADLTARPWFSIFNDSFNRIEALSGINYVYQAIATSQVIPTTGGSASTPDILIGGHSIDGQSGTNTLAYNYFPNVGDMVIDTDNTTFFGDATNSSLAARNTIMHEAGHGIGLSHVESSTSAFLMEPFINTAFDGPQLDDILAYQRGYGDVLEKNGGNNTFGTATNLGTIGSGATVSRGTLGSTTLVAASGIDFVSIDDESDVDFFSFTVTAAATVTLTLTPRGTTYLQGPQGGPEASFNTTSQSDLTLQLLDVDGSAVLQTANATALGGTETISGFAIASAGTYFVRVSGMTTDKIQLYGLDAALNENEAPSFSKGANQTVLEDAGVQSVANWATNITSGLNESGQTVEFLVSNDNPGLFSLAPVISPDGTLAYTPAPNANGTATVTIFLHDNGGTANGGADTSASQTFTITVTSVNDAPSFTVGPDLTVLVNSGARTFLNFATAISAGPNETQTVDFIVSNDNQGLFLVQPAIAANGTLTFTPAAGAFGIAEVSVQIHDNGGFANGGVDTSAVQTFTITITTTTTGAVVDDPNPVYRAPAGAKVRAVVIDGLLNVQFNGVPQRFYTPGIISTLTIIGSSKNDEIDLTGLSAAYLPAMKVVINGGAGNDKLVGSSRVDSIDGGAGNDTLSGGLGSDTLIGNAGTDLLMESAGVTIMTLTNTSLTVGPAIDTLFTIENAALTGDATDNTINASTFTRGAVTLLGGAGKDTLMGGSGNDAISGQDGDDSLTGDAGNDTLLGGFGVDNLKGGQGNDLLIGGFGVDTLDGEAGKDTIVGGNGGAARGGDGMNDGDTITADAAAANVISEAFKKLFAFE